ncbi:hypothetical protein MNKW57_12870 [Biformimicrobium ophioploci]|uniref:Uncharacterized protein n=1 Tax=Biformimicrobium ophioploci TaxID=3036711 RepID=A0ABQ6LXY5_9GAMM|nr:hypothetical protein MNKW57_12870 [Microbulbifer sp. NKW57]
MEVWVALVTGVFTLLGYTLSWVPAFAKWYMRDKRERVDRDYMRYMLNQDGSEAGPFCLPCHEQHDKLFTLRDEGNQEWRCHNCRQSYGPGSIDNFDYKNSRRAVSY